MRGFGSGSEDGWEREAENATHVSHDGLIVCSSGTKKAFEAALYESCVSLIKRVFYLYSLLKGVVTIIHLNHVVINIIYNLNQQVALKTHMKPMPASSTRLSRSA